MVQLVARETKMEALGLKTALVDIVYSIRIYTV